MEFAAPSPESSSSSDSRPSYSPHFMSSDLGLDPSDPLNLLLHNSSQSSSGDSSMEESSQEGGSPPDWSQLSALWPESDAGHMKPYMDPMDFSDLTSLSMDMDFNPSMSIEPSSLHFDPTKFTNYAYGDHLAYTNDLLTPHFPFTFQTAYSNNELSSSNTSPQLSADGRRRLSVTSSSSGASFSPAPESVPSPAAIPTHPTEVPQSYTPTISAYAGDPAAELAERVRQSAGVMLALPMNAQLQALEMKIQASASVSSSPATAPKLPIPRLPQHMAASMKSNSTVSSAASTPPPSTPSPPPSASTPNPTSTSLPRPKTSHTTIERRYRTNLNARIQSLRMAVPALRVVEDRDGGKKKAPNKVLVSNDSIKLEGQDVIGAGGVIDVIDERGFVDGVKVARKCSKANVLGKAVEYIRVLKKRENRLKAEQSGLKALVSGLVGGPALLREWEREWRERFGGEEKDEVEGEVDAEGDDEDSEDEQDEEEEGRKRKRGKTAAAPVVKKVEKKPLENNGVVPEKRKRGRPRKIVPPITPVDQSPIMGHQGTSMTNEQGAPQYLLAVFALFSFFNSPLTTSPMPSSSHTHTGTVLNSPVTVASGSWGMTEYVQMFHLMVSVVVLLSFISTWAGFGLGPGSLTSISWRHRSKRQNKTRSDWLKLGEEYVLAGPNQNVSLYTRIQIYQQISSRSAANAQDLSTAALVVYSASNTFGGLAKIKAQSVWNTAMMKAQKMGGTTSYEKIVLEGMTVDEAFERLSKSTTKRDLQSPIQILAGALIEERVRKHLGLLFIGSVRTNAEEERDADDKDQLEQDVLERQKTVEAAKEIGGAVGELGRTLERVWKLGVDCQVDVEDTNDEDSGVNGEIKALLAALVLYRRLFPSVGNSASALLSPPPSPGRMETSEVGMLRRALGSRAFEESNVLEDARDRAVDMVVELERRSVGLD